MTQTVSVESVKRLGELVRRTRKSQGLRQDEVGPFSHSFVGEVERGKPTAQVGKLFDLLRELGIRIHVELPVDVVPDHRPLKDGP